MVFQGLLAEIVAALKDLKLYCTHEEVGRFYGCSGRLETATVIHYFGLLYGTNSLCHEDLAKWLIRFCKKSHVIWSN